VVTFDDGDGLDNDAANDDDDDGVDGNDNDNADGTDDTEGVDIWDGNGIGNNGGYIAILLLLVSNEFGIPMMTLIN
jgi:hypothetical protein